MFNMKIFTLIIVCNVIRISNADDVMGPADLEIERIEACENSDSFDMQIPIIMRKLNRTHAGFSGCTQLIAELNEKAMLNLTAAKWGDGGWKPNAFNYFQPNMCKVLNDHVQKPWNAVAQAAGLPDGTCPIAMGRYCVEKLTFELEGLFPKMLYGKFRVDAFVIIGPKPIACIRAFVNSNPAKAG